MYNSNQLKIGGVEGVVIGIKSGVKLTLFKPLTLEHSIGKSIGINMVNKWINHKRFTIRKMVLHIDYDLLNIVS